MRMRIWLIFIFRFGKRKFAHNYTLNNLTGPTGINMKWIQQQTKKKMTTRQWNRMQQWRTRVYRERQKKCEWISLRTCVCDTKIMRMRRKKWELFLLRNELICISMLTRHRQCLLGISIQAWATATRDFQTTKLSMIIMLPICHCSLDMCIWVCAPLYLMIVKCEKQNKNYLKKSWTNLIGLVFGVCVCLCVWLWRHNVRDIHRYSKRNETGWIRKNCLSIIMQNYKNKATKPSNDLVNLWEQIDRQQGESKQQENKVALYFI